MNKIAAVHLVWGTNRYSATTSESIIADTANTSEYLTHLKLFGEVLFIAGEEEPFYSSLFQEVNTPETALDPSYLIENYTTLFLDYSDTYILQNATDRNSAIIYMNCPYTTNNTCFLTDDKFTENTEFYNWAKTATQYSQLPRTPEEVESDRIREEEEEKRRLTEVRPEQQGSIALVQIMDSIQFQVQIITLDLANTRVRDVQRYLAKIHKLTWYDGGLFSTNELSIDRVKKYFQDSRNNMANCMVIREEAINMFMSVVHNQKYGSKKKVGVDGNNREHITSSQRLADIKGNVIVYYHNGLSRESTISQFGEIFLNAVVDILIG